MSRKSKWHVMPGSGEYHLAKIESDVLLWNRIKPALATFEERATTNSSNAGNLARLAIERAISASTFGPEMDIEEFLDPSFR